ncbi:MAPK/MAK/MRK overlapping kinase isoform X5 [Prinia subflava]|uniref:MAPK/MAK/MRK overlapping kinase isoform X5 n=1 Tax=Prinia subflava TaxID=208062 RepID=UPI002FE30A22
MKQHFESDKNPGSLSLVCELIAMNIYELIKEQKWDISQRWATRKHYNKVCRVHEAVIPSHLALSSPCGSFQPLFLGSNELDHVSKIHEVTGTPGNKTPTVQAQTFRISAARMEKHPSPGKNFYRVRFKHLNKTLQGNLYCCYSH